MYQPSHFEESRAEVLHAAIGNHPLTTLIRTDLAGALRADVLPMLLDSNGAHGTLRGHVARANPLWREADGREVLLVFQGAQSYISPGWYPSKSEHGKVVPTWNYVVVQARGRLRAIDDAAWLRGFVTRLTERFEASMQPAPWRVADAPDDYIEAMLRAIVGIEVEIASLVGKWKVSQNRGAADREGVAAGLAALAARTGDAQAAAMAAEVARRAAD
jgi:transcriptional regulator